MIGLRGLAALGFHGLLSGASSHDLHSRHPGGRPGALPHERLFRPSWNNSPARRVQSGRYNSASEVVREKRCGCWRSTTRRAQPNLRNSTGNSAAASPPLIAAKSSTPPWPEPDYSASPSSAGSRARERLRPWRRRREAGCHFANYSAQKFARYLARRTLLELARASSNAISFRKRKNAREMQTMPIRCKTASFAQPGGSVRNQG